MVKVILKKGEEIKTVFCEKGKTILQCIRENKMNLETPCNGNGFCGKCKVKAIGNLSELTKEESKFINEEENERLACIAKIQGEVLIEFLKLEKSLKTINRGYSIEVPIDSVIKKYTIKNIEKDSTPYIENTEILNLEPISSSIYEHIGKYENKEINNIEVVAYNNKIIDIGLNHEIKNILAVAIDIGTTGISSYLINVESGEILNKNSSLNPQTQFGGDVLTRITYCMENPNGVKELQDSIIEEINKIILTLIGDSYFLDNIYNVTIAANTTMLHLLLGVSPVSLAKAPYRSVFLNKMEINCKDIGININKNGMLTILPSASSYIGADIISGAVACNFHSKNNKSVFIDIGTNGEMLALNKNQIVATSTAAGPALEGMNIDCGCRAEKGAIESFYIDENLKLNYTTIDNSEPIGICGSGLIDITAALINNNIILKSGKFRKDLPSILADKIKDKKFYITEKIYISQKDIRQIQLAKAAIATGIKLLLKELKLNIEEIEEIYIAGAFGYHINGESIKTIGLIPKGFKGKIIFLGNTSIEGARLSIINKEILESMEKLKRNIKVLELSTSDQFQNQFIKELSF